MKVTIALLLFIQTSFAQAPKRSPLVVGQIIFNPSNYEPGRFVIAYKDYEDIRIDSDWDGSIDLWRLKKGPLEVEVSYKKGIIQTFYVKKIMGSQVHEALYRNSSNKLKMTYSKIRPLQKWAFDVGVSEESGSESGKETESSGANPQTQPQANMPNMLEKLSALVKSALPEKVKDSALCSTAEPTTRKAQAELAEMQKSLFTDFMSDGGFDPSCDSILSRREKQQITNNLARILFDQDSMEKCFQDPQFKEKLTKSDADLLGFKGVEASYQLQKKSLMKPSEQKKGFIRCQTDEDKKNFKPMEATEDGKFVVHKLKEDSEDAKFSVEMITHELLHLSGIEKEELVDKVQGTCGNFAKENKKQMVIANLANNTSVFSVTLKGNVLDGVQSSAAESSAEIASEANKPQGNARVVAKQPAASGSRTIASESSVNMKEEMALAQVATPEPATLSRMISDPPPRTEEGAVAALSQSASESSGTLRMANNMMGALSTPSIASDSLAKSDRVEPSKSPTARKENSRSELGQELKAREVSNNFATLAKSTVKSTVKSDERVVESITLDGSSGSADTVSRSASAANPASSKSKSGETRTNRSPASELASSDSSRALPSASGRSALGASSNSDSPAGITPKNNLEATVGEGPKRGPASASASGKNSVSSANTAVKEETITFVANGSYSTVKSKLKDSTFSKQLETQKITILDLYGNSYGAPKGEVIFLDQGDRFVRQK